MGRRETSATLINIEKKIYIIGYGFTYGAKYHSTLFLNIIAIIVIIFSVLYFHTLWE